VIPWAQGRHAARGLRHAAVVRGPQQQQGSVVKAPSAAHGATGKCGTNDGRTGYGSIAINTIFRGMN